METAEQYYETVHLLRLRIVELEIQAYLDPLTSLYNRRAFDERMDQAISRARRTKGCVSLAIIDLDDFKAINDGFGHPAGDECLKRFAAIIRSKVRTEDIVARIGGEEFAIIFPDAREEDALVSVRRIADELRKIMMGGRAITFSAGVSCACESESLSENLIGALDLYTLADAAMYEVKRNGKDRVSGCMESIGAAA